ncbi:hypothetical protein Leryth_027634 [Lithospermum erythrorhizon]|nr:hypothetical protein Leryth_027634 [Lithospermum erythrorhizon]
MLGGGNSEKMVVLSSTTTNNYTAENQKGSSLIASPVIVMEKPNQDQQQQQHHPPPHQQQLKCPRCDSSNTKFCYYNNYSLSQPRHFCKACKRYWTRGGTLRNVPVGGGCRKNKRVKRPSSSSSSANEVSSSSFLLASNNPNNHHIDLSSSITSTHQHINPLFYGLPTNASELSLPPYTNLTRVDGTSAFDQFNNVLGLGFETSGILGLDHVNSIRNNTNIFKNGSNPILSNYQVGSVVGSSSSSTIASLVGSSLQQQNKYISASSGGLKDMQGGGQNGNFGGLFTMENLRTAENAVEGGSAMMKDVKMEGSQQNRFDWNSNIPTQQNQIHHQINSSSDPSLWNTNGGSSWLDPSVPSLI